MHKKFLKKYFFINKFDKSIIDIQSKDTTIIYRNYKKKERLNEILILRDYCKKRSLNFIISNNINLCIKLGLGGAYIPSFNKSFNHLSYTLRNNFKLIGSAHNLKEIRIKEKQGIKEVFISSIFKRNKNFLGINKFKLISKLVFSEVIALGGISKQNLKLVYLTKSTGVAGISLFMDKKKAPKKGPFK